VTDEANSGANRGTAVPTTDLMAGLYELYVAYRREQQELVPGIILQLRDDPQARRALAQTFEPEPRDVFEQRLRGMAPDARARYINDLQRGYADVLHDLVQERREKTQAEVADRLERLKHASPRAWAELLRLQKVAAAVAVDGGRSHGT
jgi:hypothetical protein